MENSLDEITCIPTAGGLKPPYQIISHEYCINIISAYNSLSKIEFSNKDHLLNSIKERLIRCYFCFFGKTRMGCCKR